MSTTPFPFQLEDVRRVEDEFDGRALLAHEVGLGKAQPLDAKILTPSGWTKMGLIRPGDRIIGADGRPTRVVAVHPQGPKLVYRIRFRDGTSTECCDDHLWAVRTTTGKWLGKPFRVRSLKQIRQSRYDQTFIPMVQPVHFDEKPVPVDPYLLGYLIANGSLSQGWSAVSIPDQETADRISSIVRLLGLKMRGPKRVGGIDYCVVKDTPTKSSLPNRLTDELRALRLLRKRAESKFVPMLYRYNSVAVRVALLQGLMDGDGSAGRTDGHTEYSTSSKWLARHVVEIVQSLGGVARQYKPTRPGYVHNGEKKTGQLHYRISITMPDGIIPFRLSRKANRCRPRVKYGPSRAIVGIDPVGVKECQCITVAAADGLYVTDGYIVTHNSLMALLYAHNHPEARPAVIVCPAGLKYNWEREAKKHFNMPVQILETTYPPTGKEYFRISGSKVYIVNYDILIKRQTKKKNGGEGWLRWLKELNPQLVIFDEAHYCSGRTSKRTRAVRELCAGAPHVLALTGTPITSRPAELWPIVNIVRPDLYPAFWPFARSFCNPKRTPWGWDFGGACRLRQLNRELREGLMIRRRKVDVFDQLPPKRRAVVPVQITDRAQYQRAVADFLGWLKQRDPAKVFRAARAEALVRVGYVKRLAAELKLNSVRDWIDTFLQGSDEKLIVFGIHKKVLHGLHAHYRKNSVIVDGGVTGRSRQQAVDQFIGTKDTRLLFGNIRAAGAGWSAPGVTNTATIEFEWAAGLHNQAEGRCHGIGRGSETIPSTNYYLVARGTIEEKICKILQRRQSNLDAALDGGLVNESTFDLFDQFCKVLQSDYLG